MRPWFGVQSPRGPVNFAPNTVTNCTSTSAVLKMHVADPKWVCERRCGYVHQHDWKNNLKAHDSLILGFQSFLCRWRTELEDFGGTKTGELNKEV